MCEVLETDYLIIVDDKLTSLRYIHSVDCWVAVRNNIFEDILKI